MNLSIEVSKRFIAEPEATALRRDGSFSLAVNDHISSQPAVPPKMLQAML
jgi:hypothetical protein